MLQRFAFAMVLILLGGWSTALAAQATVVPGSAPTAPQMGADSAQVATVPESLYVVLLETGPAYRRGAPPDQQPGFAGRRAISI